MLATASHYWPLDAVDGIHELWDQIGNRPGYVNGSNISMCTPYIKRLSGECTILMSFSDCSLHGLKLFFITHLPAIAIMLVKCAAVFRECTLYVGFISEIIKLNI